MIYPYECGDCGYQFEVIKSVRQIDDPEFCPECGDLEKLMASPCRRCIGRPNLVAIHDWTETFNPAFGQVVKNKAHQREILVKLKDQGKEFIEIGNEPVDNVHKHFDGVREQKRNERWNTSLESDFYEATK